MDVVVSKKVYAFAEFALDVERRLLWRGGEAVSLHPKAFDLLLVLIENRDRVLSKTELLDAVWENQFVEENNLAVQVSTLRKIFGERKDEHRYIVTVPNKGYRFVAEVFERKADERSLNEAKEFAADEANVNHLEAEDANEKTPFRYLLPVGIAFVFVAALVSIYQFGKPQAAEAVQIKLNKLTAAGNITNAALTRDGKFAVLAQKESAGESLWLKQIETGTQTRIAAPQAVEYVGLTVSPDNQYVYFSIFPDNKSGGWLRRMPLLGGAAQEIEGIDSGVSVSFAPDGRRFVFTESGSAAKETRLVVADADGAQRRTLLLAEAGTRKLPAYKANPAAWSPDGDEIACAVMQKNGGDIKTGILLINAENGDERFLLAPQFAWIDNVVWTDAKTLAFVASETDEWSSQIWTISKMTGETRQLTNDLQKYFWLSAAGNTLLTVQENSVGNLCIADFDERANELLPRRMLRETNIDYAAFGSDNLIYYVSQAGGKRDVWRVGKDGANPVQITTDARISYGFAVSPVDRSIVFTSARAGKHSLWRTDANGSNYRRLTDADDIAPQFSADGGQIVFQRGLYDFPTVWKTSLDGNAAVRLTEEHALKPTISPDGSQAAYFLMDDAGAWQISLISTATGALINKLDFPTTVNERRMRWHPSGKYLTLVFSAGENFNLMLLPVDGGKPKIVGNLGKGEINSFDWSPDGKRIVFTQTDKSNDAVLLTGF